MADTPESKGLPKVTYFAQDAAEDHESYWSVFFRCVVRNRQLWVIAIVNLCVYIIRFGTLDWTTKFLVERKGYAVATAAGMASTMPLFGIGGVLVRAGSPMFVFKGRFKFVNSIMLAGLGLAIRRFISGRKSRTIRSISCFWPRSGFWSRVRNPSSAGSLQWTLAEASG